MKNCSENEVATELCKLIGANNKDHEKVFERESRIFVERKVLCLAYSENYKQTNAPNFEMKSQE